MQINSRVFKMNSIGSGCYRVGCSLPDTAWITRNTLTETHLIRLCCDHVKLFINMQPGGYGCNMISDDEAICLEILAS